MRDEARDEFRPSVLRWTSAGRLQVAWRGARRARRRSPDALPDGFLHGAREASHCCHRDRAGDATPSSWFRTTRAASRPQFPDMEMDSTGYGGKGNRQPTDATIPRGATTGIRSTRRGCSAPPYSPNCSRSPGWSHSSCGSSARTGPPKPGLQPENAIQGRSIAIA